VNFSIPTGLAGGEIPAPPPIQFKAKSKQINNRGAKTAPHFFDYSSFW